MKKTVQTQTAPCHSPVPDSHSIEKWAWLGTELIKVTPTAKHWGTALVCKMLLGGEKKEYSYKNTPVPHLCQTLIQTEDKIHIYFTPSKEKMYFLYAEKTEKYIEIKKNTY